MNSEAWMELKIRLRPDIQWSRMGEAGDANWVARDPISLDCFYFSSLERAIAARLDGATKLSEILAQYQRRRVSKNWLLRLIAKLESACLTTARTGGADGLRLSRARAKTEKRNALQLVLSPLAVRFKLLDPTPMLEFLTPLARMVFSRIFVLLTFLFVASVGLTVLLRLLRTPWSPSNLLTSLTAEGSLLLIGIYLCVKSLHELGHALACRKWGCECHEIGVYLLVFMPCLYCNTTDSWKLPGWRRACIAAAGIYVELVIAALAGLLWLVTPATSQLHLLAANTMVICSISTFLVNANPLLRYDGYYILSDLWGVPNLHQQSREAAQGVITWWLTGRPIDGQRWDAAALPLALYGVIAWIYRHVVVLLIAWFVWHLLNDIGFPLLGALLVLTTLCSVIISLSIGAFQWLKEWAGIGEIHVFRTAFLFLLLVSALVAYFRLPLPTFVTARGFASYAQMIPLYAGQAGTLTNFIDAKSEIDVGTSIASIESPSLELQLIETRGEVATLSQRLTQLNILSVDLESAYTELATVREQLEDAKGRLRILENELNSLNISAPTKGIVLPCRHRFANVLTELPDRSSRQTVPISERVGSFVERGTQLAWICNPNDFVAKVLVVEHDAELISIGMPIHCRWECELNRVWPGSVIDISPEPITELPEALIGDRSIAVNIEGNGAAQPAQPHYEITIDLESWPSCLSHHHLATVHIDIPDRTLHECLRSLFDRNIRSKL